MFDKIKKLKKIKDLQNSLKKETIEKENNGIKVVVNGQLQIQDITLNSDLAPKEQENEIKDLINSAMRDMQMKAAKKMQGMQGN